MHNNQHKEWAIIRRLVSTKLIKTVKGISEQYSQKWSEVYDKVISAYYYNEKAFDCYFLKVKFHNLKDRNRPH